MATTKPKTPPKAPAKAKAADPAPAIPPTGGGTDPAPVADPTIAKVDQALQQQPAGTESTATNEVNPQLVKAPKADKAKADVDTALDRLGKIESEAIRMGGDSGQAIRQLACEAMVALGFK